MAVKSFVGLHNSGNTCFLAAGSNIAIWLKEICRFVRRQWYNSICAEKNCFLCTWESLASKILQLTSEDVPLNIETLAKQFAILNPLYEVGKVFDAAEVVGAIVDGYEKRIQRPRPGKCVETYLNFVRTVLSSLKIETTTTLYCLECSKRDESIACTVKTPEKTNIFFRPLTRDTENLLAGDEAIEM